MDVTCVLDLWTWLVDVTCGRDLCTWLVYATCVRDLCTWLVYVNCVRDLCTWLVYVTCVRDLCTRLVYVTCVHDLWTWLMDVTCARDLCTWLVYVTCVRDLCTWLVSGDDILIENANCRKIEDVVLRHWNYTALYFNSSWYRLKTHFPRRAIIRHMYWISWSDLSAGSLHKYCCNFSVWSGILWENNNHYILQILY